MIHFDTLAHGYRNVVREFKLGLLGDLSTRPMWRSPVERFSEPPHQGFKIHLSFTLRSFTEYVRAVVKHLCSRRIPFKAVRNLEALQDLNFGECGLSQVGKAITVYPPDVNSLLSLAQELAELCAGARGPFVLSDRKVPFGSNLYYRFGSFTGDGSSILNEETGQAQKDARDPLQAVPDWIDDPFLVAQHNAYFPSRLIFLRTIRQRPKGGVYEALLANTKSRSVAPVIVKEARWCGEEDLCGVDAIARLKNQVHWMTLLAERGCVPRVIDAFNHGPDYFVVMSKAEGMVFDRWLTTSPPRTARRRVRLALEAAVQDLHDAEVFLCDLSDDNIVVGRNEEIIFSDLELVWRPDLPLQSNYGTPDYIIRYPRVFSLGSREARLRDQYALQRLRTKLA